MRIQRKHMKIEKIETGALFPAHGKVRFRKLEHGRAALIDGDFDGAVVVFDAKIEVIGAERFGDLAGLIRLEVVAQRHVLGLAAHEHDEADNGYDCGGGKAYVDAGAQRKLPPSLGDAHRELRGTPCRLQPWWPSGDTMAFGSFEAP